MPKPALLAINFMSLEIQLYSKFKTYLMFLRLFLGGFADSVYVSEEANDRFNSELKPELCKSFTFALNNVSRHNDTIPGGRTCQVLYRCEHTIVIKHSYYYKISKIKYYSCNYRPFQRDKLPKNLFLLSQVLFWYRRWSFYLEL